MAQAGKPGGWTTVAALAVALIAASVGGIGAFVFTRNVSSSAKARVQERDSLSQVARSAESVAGGGRPIEGIEFPDTDLGQISRAIHEASLEESRLQEAFARDWVMTPDSLKDRESLDESLRRLSLARTAVARLKERCEAGLDRCVAKLDRLSKSGPQAQAFVANFMNGLNRPGGGRELSASSFASIRKNHDALERALRFLRDRVGKFSVAGDGSVMFDSSLPDSDVEAYNRIISEVNESIEATLAVERERARRLKSAADRLAG
jgi:hypothetical protein